MIIESILPLVGSFRDQVVLVTGASSGIGRETALLFAQRGARVALAARRRDLLEEVAAAVRAAGGAALVVPTDVTDPAAARAAATRVRRAWGHIDVLVNNAGVLKPAPVAKLRAADLEAMLRVNLFGALFMTQAVLPGMERRGSGSIINVASLAGRRGVTPLGGYCATKFALIGLSEALRTEVDPARVHVGVVLPGVVETPMAQGIAQAGAVPEWPMALNMPPEWIAAAVALAVRFRLHEVSVPPGAALLEEIAALAPGATDALIGWMQAAGRLLSAFSSQPSAVSPPRSGRPQGGRRRTADTRARARTPSAGRRRK
ncbi:MAG TPA: SDR family oxidoreductase [Candidatus Dormibacteraeota bacterium]|nr:SDR family oxidoreductase [Candidatus Dormibacteraeota bacterium]